MKFYQVITNTVIFLIIFNGVDIVITIENSCCDTNIYISKDGIKCQNNKNLSINCGTNEKISRLNDEDYIIVTNVYGETYLNDDYGNIVKEPFFCHGKLDHDTAEIYIACVCTEMMEKEKEDSFDEITLCDQMSTIFRGSLHCLSGLFLAATAAIYGIFKKKGDSQRMCTFHFTLNMSVFHFSVLYVIYYNKGFTLNLCMFKGFALDFCIFNLYSFVYIVLSSFIWCSILSFNSWIHVRNEDGVDEKKLIKYYRYFGYGVPTYIVGSNLIAHATRLFTSFDFEWDCMNHITWILFFSTTAPMILTLFSNFLFYFDTQRRLWSPPSLKLTTKKSKLFHERAKYRMIMNLKLFFIMGIPWVGCCAFRLINFEIGTDIFVLAMASEGIFIFLILVVLRKGVMRSIVNELQTTNYIILLPKIWKTSGQNSVNTDQTEVDSSRDFGMIQSIDDVRNLGVPYQIDNNVIII